MASAENKENAANSTEPQALVAFRALLQAEKEAACQADVDRLMALQEAKQMALPALLECEASSAAKQQLQAAAQRNVRLLRQLVQCLAGVVGGETADGTYDARGCRNVANHSAWRGQL